jgi:myo-inositol-1(or 4)-monophosphatase
MRFRTNVAGLHTHCYSSRPEGEFAGAVHPRKRRSVYARRLRLFSGRKLTSLQAEARRRLDSLPSVIAEVSGILLELQTADLNIRTKSNDKDLVTRADLESETRLRSFVERNFPGDHVMGEEGGGSLSGAGFTWVIDPVDGTINYAHGLPLFAISIGLTLDGTIAGGLVHMPALGTTYTAVKSMGAYCGQRKISVSPTTNPSQALVVTGFPYDRSDKIEYLLGGVRSVLQNCRGIRRTGSAAVDLCWLAHGKFDVHYEMNLSPWDTCAGELIVREAGGLVTTFAGRDHQLTDKSLLATNGHLHDAMLKILEGMQ